MPLNSSNMTYGVHHVAEEQISTNNSVWKGNI